MPVLLPPLTLWIAAMLAMGLLALHAAVPRGRTRPLRARVLARALLPNRMLRSRSGQLDIAAFLISVLVASATLELGRSVSIDWWARLTEHALDGWTAFPVRLPMRMAAMLLTAVSSL